MRVRVPPRPLISKHTLLRQGDAVEAAHVGITRKRVQTESVVDEGEDTVDRDHDDHADDAPYHVLLADAVVPSFIQLEEELDESVDKEKEPEPENDQERGVDDVDDDALDCTTCRVHDGIGVARMRVRARTLSLEETSSATCRINLDTLRDNGGGRGHGEGALQESDDAPDGNHDEYRQDAVEHYLQTFGFRLSCVGEVLDKAPKEDDDGEGDKEADERIQEGIGECQGIEERRCTRKCRKHHRTRSDQRKPEFPHKIKVFAYAISTSWYRVHYETQ